MPKAVLFPLILVSLLFTPAGQAHAARWQPLCNPDTLVCMNAGTHPPSLTTAENTLSWFRYILPRNAPYTSNNRELVTYNTTTKAFQFTPAGSQAAIKSCLRENTLIACIGTAFQITKDNGATWSTPNSQLDGDQLLKMPSTPGEHRFLIAKEVWGGIFPSYFTLTIVDEQGQVIVPSQFHTMSGRSFNAFANGPQGQDILISAWNHGRIYLSTDLGQSIVPLPEDPVLAAEVPSSLDRDPDQPMTYWLGTSVMTQRFLHRSGC